MPNMKIALQEAQRITLIGAVIDALLGVIKITVGILAHSAALVADGVHSLSDLATDALVVVMLRISHQGPDIDHPWGHGRFETLGTVILGCMLIAVAGAMAFDSIRTLLNQTALPLPTWPALMVAALSIAAKEWIYRYTMHVAKKLKSDLLIANAWHSRTDALSSIVVFIGVAGAMAGVIWLDALAALLVSLAVAHIGWKLSWQSLMQLVDTALPVKEVEAFKETVLSIDGILDVHSFKTRQIGNQSALEMHLQVSPGISASEGHFLGDTAVNALKNQHDEISQAIFHIDTYNDEVESHKLSPLPLRNEILPSIENFLQQHPDYQLHRLNLYYNHATLDIELWLTCDTYSSISRPDSIALRNHLESPAWLTNIRIAIETP